MAFDDEDTHPGRLVIPWRAGRPLFADVNRWVHLDDVAAYAKACTARCVGVKVTEGSSWSGTPAAHALVEACLRAGLVVVGYAYGPNDSAAFLKAFPPRPGCIPCLDFEFGKDAPADADEWSRRLEVTYSWIREVTDAWGGHAPWFYGRNTWVAAGQPTGTPVSGCPYWGPQYGQRLLVPRGVGRAVAWQYSDGQHGPEPRTHAGIERLPGGATKPCDMNALLASAADLRAMAGLDR